MKNKIKLSILALLLIVFSISVFAVAEQSSETPTAATSPTTNTAIQESAQTSTTTSSSTTPAATPASAGCPYFPFAKGSPEQDDPAKSLINDYNTLAVNWSNSNIVAYSSLIMYSLDNSIAGRAALDQATGYFKIAQFRKDFFSVACAPPVPETTGINKQAETSFGISIDQLSVKSQDNNVVFDSAITITDTTNYYSYNFLLTDDKNDYILLNDQSQTLFNQGESAGQRTIKTSKSIADLQKNGLKGTITNAALLIYKIQVVKLPLEDVITATNNAMQAGGMADNLFVREISLVGTGLQPTTYNPQFHYDFSDSQALLKLIFDTPDSKDTSDFRYQYEILLTNGKTIIYPTTRTSFDNIQTRLATYYPDLGNQGQVNSIKDIKSITLNAYSYESAPQPIYSKTIQVTNPEGQTVSPCTSCNAPGQTCYNDACTKIGIDCLFIPDTKQNFFAEGWDKFAFSLSLSSFAAQQPGTCKDKKLSTADEECRSRCPNSPSQCDSKICSGADNKCRVSSEGGVVITDQICHTTPTVAGLVGGTSTAGAKTLVELYNAYGSTIAQAAKDNSVDQSVIYGLIMQESSGNPNAANGHCVGLMQICPDTAKTVLGSNALSLNCNSVSECPNDPRFGPSQAIPAGTKIYATYFNQFSGTYQDAENFAIAAYNMGPAPIKAAIARLGNNNILWQELSQKITTDDLKNHGYPDSAGWTDSKRSAKLVEVKNHVVGVLKYKAQAQAMLGTAATPPSSAQANTQAAQPTPAQTSIQKASTQSSAQAGFILPTKITGDTALLNNLQIQFSDSSITSYNVFISKQDNSNSQLSSTIPKTGNFPLVLGLVIQDDQGRNIAASSITKINLAINIPQTDFNQLTSDQQKNMAVYFVKDNQLYYDNLKCSNNVCSFSLSSLVDEYDISPYKKELETSVPPEPSDEPAANQNPTP